MKVINIFGLSEQASTQIPLFAMSVAAGSPVPAENDIENTIDLNEFLVKHPASTFFAHVMGDNLNDTGILDGDILIIDTSIEPSNGKIVLVKLGDALSVKIFRDNDNGVYLQTDKESFIPLKISDGFEFEIIGTAIKLIHSI